MELVKRDDVIDVWHIRVPDEDKEDFLRAIKGLPTVDGRIKGEWQITSAYPHNVYCSICNRRYAQTHWAVWNDPEMPLPRNYCPNCGADMRGEE